jgi:hypothetical protein
MTVVIRLLTFLALLFANIAIANADVIAYSNFGMNNAYIYPAGGSATVIGGNSGRSEAAFQFTSLATGPLTSIILALGANFAPRVQSYRSMGTPKGTLTPAFSISIYLWRASTIQPILAMFQCQ